MMVNATRNATPLPEDPPRPHTRRRDRDPGRERQTNAHAAPMVGDSVQDPPEPRQFPGWRWVAVAIAFPIAGYIGWMVGGRVDAVGAALVGGALTGAGSLAIMGVVSGAALGAAQGLVLAREGRHRLALPWGLAMPVLFGLGWCASTGIGVSVDDQFTVFGAAGSTLFMLLSGLLLARFTPARMQMA